MLSKDELEAIKKVKAQSRARMRSRRSKSTSGTKTTAAAAGDADVADIICDLAKALKAECDFLRGGGVIVATRKVATDGCAGCKKKPAKKKRK